MSIPTSTLQKSAPTPPQGMASVGSKTPDIQTPIAGKSYAMMAKATSTNTYDPTRIQSDFGNWRTNLLSYYTTTIKSVDDYYEMRQPNSPYFQIYDLQGNPTAYQYISPIIRSGVDSVLSFVRSDSIAIRVPAGDSPGASQEDLSDTESVLRFIYDYHSENVPYDQMEERKLLLALRGAYVAQFTWLDDPADAQALNNGMPMRIDVHDPLDCSYILGNTHALEKIIVQKRRTASELPLDWQTQLDVTDENQEFVVLEYFDRTHSAAVVGTDVVKPLTPHGYVNNAGEPCVPFVLCQHKARPQRLGQIGPDASGLSQRAFIVGTPLVESILPLAEIDSRVKTYFMYNTKLTARGLLKMKGVVQREGNANVDMDAGVIELEDSPSSDAQWLSPPALAQAITPFLSMLSSDIAQAYISGGILSGEIQQNVSGIAANHMTSFARSKAIDFSYSFARGLTNECSLMIGMMRYNLIASAARLYAQANNGAQLPLADPNSELAKGHPMPFSSRITGDEHRPIDPVTFANINRVIVDVTPDTKTPRESDYQTAIALKQANGLVDDDYIRSKFLHIDNVAEVNQRIALQGQLNDPQSPFAQLKAREAMLNELAPLLDPAQVAQYRQQYAVQGAQILADMFSTPIAPPQGPTGVSPSAPTGAPPQGGQPPAGPPLPNGANPNGQMPMQAPPQVMPPVGIQGAPAGLGSGS